MNHDVLKAVIFDQHEVVKNAPIVARRYSFELRANYVLTGLRRAGKSTLLYKIARDLVADGMPWNRIVYVMFEDERLAEFSVEDFNDIVAVQAELSADRGVYFFDEIQTVKGWEKFVRRLADAGERVYVTGSNAAMLSGEVASTLGGRFLVQQVDTYRFDEYLEAVGQPFDAGSLYATRAVGRLAGHFDDYLLYGGFPESLRYQSRRLYVESVYQKVLLGDIAARKGIRNVQALRILVKKVAETVCNEVSFTTLHGMLKAIGLSASKNSVIDYMAYAEEAYLLFGIRNAVAAFAERESNPKYYFSDNGLLGLFGHDRTAALLENLVACMLRQRYGEELFYLKSPKTGIDIDFYIPKEDLAIQVAYSIEGNARKREVGNLVKLARTREGSGRYLIVTKGEEAVIEEDGVRIEVVPAWKWLLTDVR